MAGHITSQKDTLLLPLLCPARAYAHGGYPVSASLTIINKRSVKVFSKNSCIFFSSGNILSQKNWYQISPLQHYLQFSVSSSSLSPAFPAFLPAQNLHLIKKNCGILGTIVWLLMVSAPGLIIFVNYLVASLVLLWSLW